MIRLGKRPPPDAQRVPGLDLGVPGHILLCLAVFAAVNLWAIRSMHGVADAEGYLLNTSKLVPVNTYEDDAQVTMGHAMGLYGEVKDTFSIGTNFGGPLLHGGRAVVWAGAKLGLVKLCDDPLFYVAYPEELRALWQLFALYKLVVLLLLPLSVYWIARNFDREATGTIAVWLLAAMPFLPAYELRLKPEGVVLAMTLLALLNLLEHMRSGRARHLFTACAFLGLAFSMKFTLAPAGLLAVAAFFVSRRRRGLPWLSREALILAAKACCVVLATFLAANPLFLHAPRIFTSFVARYSSVLHAYSGALPLPQSFAEVTWYRLTHFEPYLGQALNLLVLPALAFALWRLVSERFRLSAQAVVLLLFVGNGLFLWWLARAQLMLVLSYYYYSQAVLALVLVAFLLGWLWDAARGPLPRAACLVGVAAVLLATFSDTLAVLRFLGGPSTRQSVHAWVRDNIPAGASLGVPMARQEHLGFTDRFMADPFRHRLVPTGDQGEHLDALRPDFALGVVLDPVRRTPEPSGYEPLLRVDTGSRLPRETYGFYQDDIYSVYRRKDGAAAGDIPGPGAAEAALGTFTRADAEPEFTILSYRGLSMFPLGLELLGKTPDTVLPLPGRLFTSALRDPAAPPAYVHQVPPELLTLWGVKYVLALQDDAFRSEVLQSGVYRLEPAQGPGLEALPQGVALYRNQGYQGRVFFLPAPPPGSTQARERSWGGLLGRGRLKPFGALYDPAAQGAVPAGLLRVRLVLDCDGPMDVLLKGGERPVSLLAGPGRQTLDLPYRTVPGREAGYEINPAAPGATCSVLAVSAEPLEIVPQPQAQPAALGMRLAFARVETPGPGEAVFALPWHGHWIADVDGRPARVLRGPGNTVAVPLQTGRHEVTLRIKP